MILLLALALTSVATTIAQPSDPPAPATPKDEGQPPKQEPSSDQKEPEIFVGTETNPAIVKITKSEEETAQDQADRYDESSARWWTVWLSAFLAILAVIQSVVYVIQAKRLKETITKMDEIAKDQSKDVAKSIAEAARAAIAMEEMSKHASMAAEAASANAEAAKDSAYVAAKSLRTTASGLATTRVIERAYVTMSHHPPGVILDIGTTEPTTEDAVTRQKVTIHIKIENFGNSPATITRTLIQSLITDEPILSTPDYDESLGEETGVYLVKNDSFTLHVEWHMEAYAITEITNHPDVWTLYIFGYVDYIDTFGDRHRAGYGRRYMPALDLPFDHARKVLKPDTNLIFITQPRYNYDRQRHEGEGTDWDAPQPSGQRPA